MMKSSWYSGITMEGKSGSTHRNSSASTCSATGFRLRGQVERNREAECNKPWWRDRLVQLTFDKRRILTRFLKLSLIHLKYQANGQRFEDLAKCIDRVGRVSDTSSCIYRSFVARHQRIVVQCYLRQTSYSRLRSSLWKETEKMIVKYRELYDAVPSKYRTIWGTELNIPPKSRIWVKGYLKVIDFRI